MLAAVICLTAVFVFANSGAFAQDTDPTLKTPAYSESDIIPVSNIKAEPAQQITVSEKTQVKQTQGAAQQQAKPVDLSTLPYYNYKGISNLDEARKAWEIENPEAANKYGGDEPNHKFTR